jgi:transcriptional regulator with PAS, ATPase and Fis domain
MLNVLNSDRPRPPNSAVALGMVGESTALHETLELAHKAARSDANILLCGESGTGKELAAQAIHTNSPRAAHPFVAVDCASLPENLLEAELFGYEKGAFTGAIGKKPGLMELAHHGTLFLDEVGEMPISLQAKILRALQEKEHRRVGGTQTVQFDLRVLAATSRDLQQRVKEGTFRKDLLFRINVIPIRLPPLREREGDVSLLAAYLLDKYCEVDTGMTKRFDSEVVHALERYSWPGNVRELQNVVRRMCVMAEGELITMRDLPEELLSGGDQFFSAETEAKIESCELTFVEAKRRCLNLFEADYVRGVLDRHAGNVSRSSEAADVDRKTFYRLLRKHHLQPHAFRTLDTYRVSA